MLTLYVQQKNPSEVIDIEELTKELTVLDPSKPLQLQISNVISWIIAVSFAYFTNRKYVFESSNQNIIHEGAAFFASRIGTLLIDMGSMFLLVTVLGMSDKVSKLIVQVLVTVGNYLLSKMLVFKKNNN